MITSLLEQLGFSKNESALYLAILKAGKTTPANLAKLTGLNRTTVYSVAKILLKQGVIREDLGGSTTYLVALPPEDLRSLVLKEEKTLIEKKATIEKLIDELQIVAQETKYAIPKVTFIVEEQLEQYLYRQTPIWTESIKQRGGTWWGFQDPTLAEHYQEWIDWFWKKHGEGISLKLLTSQSDIEEIMKKKHYERREMKFLEDTDFSSTIWVNGDFVVMVNTKQQPAQLVEIHDVSMAHNLRELFKRLWAEEKP